MNKAGAVGLCGALVVVGVIGWVAGRGMRDAGPPLPVASPDVAMPAIDASDAPEVSRLDRLGAPLPSVARPTLPPIDLPFNQSVDVLEEAARGGDVVAACRLAAEAYRCSSLRQMTKFLSNEERQIRQMSHSQLDDEQMERRITAWIDKKGMLENTLASCEGVDASSAQMVLYDSLATAAGDPLARIRYLSGERLYPGAMIGHPRLLEHYRTHALGYFMQALEAGDLEVLRLWQASTRFGELLALSSVLPEPWKDPAVVDAVIDHLTDTQRANDSVYDDNPVSEPSPEQRAEATRIYARYFADSEPRKEHTISPQAAMDAALLGMPATESPEYCLGLVLTEHDGGEQ